MCVCVCSCAMSVFRNKLPLSLWGAMPGAPRSFKEVGWINARRSSGGFGHASASLS